MLVFRCCPSNINIVFFKELFHFFLKLKPIILLKYLGIFKHATLFIDFFQRKYNFAATWALETGDWRLYILMQHWCLLRYTCACFLQKHYEAYKAKQTGAAHYVLSNRTEDDVFPLEVVYEPAKELYLLTMTWCLFLTYTWLYTVLLLPCHQSKGDQVDNMLCIVSLRLSFI